MAYGHTIAAISTPSGKGGVAIIRISGAEALDIAERVFFPRSKKHTLASSARTQIYGDVIYASERIDDGMATYFKAPNSYTGEDVVEISCHGGMLITRTVLEAVLAAGATPAEAGEFTRRAFINGRLSLVETESIGNLLEAKSREQIRLASSTARSTLSRKLSDIREALTEILSSVFARIDYPDEDLGEFDNAESTRRLYRVRDMINALISTYPTGKAISEGVRTVICGKPNVGKSTLYNAILGEDAAIVTDIEGTTRDVLTHEAPLGRVMLNLSDTAGVRRSGSADEVEKIGIERSKAAIAEAELIIAVFDSSREADGEDKSLVNLIKDAPCPKIAILNKCDMTKKFDTGLLEDGFSSVLTVSARDSEVECVNALSKAVDTLFTDEKISVGTDAVISSARHNAALLRALSFVNAAIEAYESGIYADAAASEVERALGAIAQIDGRAVAEEVVSDIFSKFCVGK